MTAEPIETRDPATIEAHKAKGGEVQVFLGLVWGDCTSTHAGENVGHRHRLLPIESPGGGASTPPSSGEEGASSSRVVTPPPGPTWEGHPGRTYSTTGPDIVDELRDAHTKCLFPAEPSLYSDAADVIVRLRDLFNDLDGADLLLRGAEAFAQPERITPPEGVTVIGWGEPTADEPRSLPIVWGRDIPAEGWERLMPNLTWREVGHPALPTAYVIRPIPEPPEAETERVPWWEAVGRIIPTRPDPLIEVGIDACGPWVAEEHIAQDSDGEGLPHKRHTWVNRDGTVEVLVERESDR